MSKDIFTIVIIAVLAVVGYIVKRKRDEEFKKAEKELKDYEDQLKK